MAYHTRRLHACHTDCCKSAVRSDSSQGYMNAVMMSGFMPFIHKAFTAVYLCFHATLIV